MEQVEYKGEIYTRCNSKWVNSKHIVVHEALQNYLNHLYSQSDNLKTHSVQELIAEGDQFKESGSFQLAISYYEQAITNCDRITLSYILPRITSCYRECNMPQKTIDLLAHAKRKYGENIVSSTLLVSVAAAYCDLGEYQNAEKCCAWAYKKFGNKVSPHLRKVWARIKKETSR